jgi:hypothetical protein
MERGNGIDYRDIEKGLHTIANKFSTKEAGFTPTPFNNLKGKNFMTPDVVSIRRLNNGIWFELSYGTGFSNDYIFGVTLMDNKGTDFHDINECVYEFSEVEEILEKAQNLTITA